MPVRYLFLILLTGFCCLESTAQRLTKEQVMDTVLPSFSIYRDNYVLSGIPLHEKISSETVDVKYQISFKQLLTRYTLPLNTNLFFTYTQKAFWTLYTFSSPFREINFKPGIGLGKPVFNKKGYLAGLAELRLEHESNGRDSIYSRKWNSFVLSYHASLKNDMVLSVTGWIPFGYREENPELIDYIGYGEINFTYDITKNYVLEVNLKKGLNLDRKGALRTRLFYRVSGRTNQHVMVEWYNGYAESLISFQEFVSMIRIGYVIKSRDLDVLKY